MTKLNVLFVLAIVGQLLDGTLTYIGMSRGFLEGNPLVATVIQVIGVEITLIIGKGISIFLVYFMWTHRYAVTLLSIANAAVYGFAVIPWCVLLLS